MKNNLVAKSNELIVASYLMSRNEQNLLLACISQIDSRPDAHRLTTIADEFVVTVEDIKQIFYTDATERNAYRDLKAAANSMYNREVVIALEGNKTLKTRFISSIEFDPDDSQVTLTFAQKILPYLTQLGSNFTRYRLADTVGLTSVHAVRLYECLACWSGQNKWSETMAIDDFKFMMGVEDKYGRFNGLRDKVINKAIEQINENTSYHVQVTYRKVKCEHRSMTFKFYKKAALELTKDGALSQEKIKRIVRSQQFMADYNNHKLLSSAGKRDNETFWAECEVLLASHPKEFSKRSFDDYFSKLKTA